MSLLLRKAACATRTLARGLFGFGKAGKQRQQIQEAQKMCSVFVDPLSKTDLKYIPERNVFLAETIGVEYPIRDGIYIMSPNEATLVIAEEKQSTV
ncbi:Tetraacyldisaccharide-1-P 4-kinase [Blastocystis hominis]|uniref:Tetraacyldisaccharide-1-P 4-kinase n=1 Tax=Blastocystis hominis TaxID=12968 RepID=D8M5Y3_BLAHO|nr:Tetraacyldisaccharide-1-P 4-kinase [Blastocystis hominis]CBK23582.2 Tetraacyldisaccharide-1-P 4-kinase [Blastocystis hominis]|eukprot:XP_012897630.1 Tetraacyldisaccharide-1-P 4-kinase [Blastocystis hominis]